MFEAPLHSGTPRFVPYTPAGAIAGGEVIVVGNLPFVAHAPIPAGDRHAVAARGGIYTLTADGPLAGCDKVYWRDDTNKATKTAAAGARKHFGFVLPDSSAAGDGDPVLVLHVPDGSQI